LCKKFIIPEQKWFFKNFFKKTYFSCAFRLISASLNEHAQRTRKTKPNYFEYKSFDCSFRLISASLNEHAQRTIKNKTKLFILILSILLCCCKFFCNFFPIDDIEKCRYILSTAILVFEVVGVFPNV